MVLKHQAEKIFFFQKNMLSFVEILKKKALENKRISINNNKKKNYYNINLYIFDNGDNKEKKIFFTLYVFFFSR